MIIPISDLGKELIIVAIKGATIWKNPLTTDEAILPCLKGITKQNCHTVAINLYWRIDKLLYPTASFLEFVGGPFEYSVTEREDLYRELMSQTQFIDTELTLVDPEVLGKLTYAVENCECKLFISKTKRVFVVKTDEAEQQITVKNSKVPKPYQLCELSPTGLHVRLGSMLTESIGGIIYHSGFCQYCKQRLLVETFDE